VCSCGSSEGVELPVIRRQGAAAHAKVRRHSVACFMLSEGMPTCLPVTLHTRALADGKWH
jgi:hypothetical protein